MCRTNKFHDDDENATTRQQVLLLFTRSGGVPCGRQFHRVVNFYAFTDVASEHINENGHGKTLWREREKENARAANSFRFQIASLIRTILMTFFDFIYGFRGASSKCMNARDTETRDDYFPSSMHPYGSSETCSYRALGSVITQRVLRWAYSGEFVTSSRVLIYWPFQRKRTICFVFVIYLRRDSIAPHCWLQPMSTVDKIGFSFRCVRRTCDSVSK